MRAAERSFFRACCVCGALDFVVAAKEKGFEGKILVVTAGITDQEVVQLLQAGVAGIVHKRNSTEMLCNPGSSAHRLQNRARPKRVQALRRAAPITPVRLRLSSTRLPGSGTLTWYCNVASKFRSFNSEPPWMSKEPMKSPRALNGTPISKNAPEKVSPGFSAK